MNRSKNLHLHLGALLIVLALGGWFRPLQAQNPLEPLKTKVIKGGLPIPDALSSGGTAAVFGPGRGPDDLAPGNNNQQPGIHDNGRGGNTFVNDPCLDPSTDQPFPQNFFNVVQSETEIAVLNSRGSMGKKMAVGYNDSYGFSDNRQGLSGYAYSINGGNTWIDGGGLPPRIPTGLPSGTLGQDAYFGDPVVVVHHPTQTFYYSSIYMNPSGYFTLSVNKGVFATSPPPGTLPTVEESRSDTRCLRNPDLQQVENPPNQKERLFWFPPVEVIVPPTGGQLNDLLDKEWLYVDQRTGTLYVTYTRFENAPTFGTPLEMVRCIACAFKPGPLTTADWTAGGVTVILANEDFDFNQATQPITTRTGRVIVTWIMRRFNNVAPFNEIENRIEYAFSDLDGAPGSFSTEQFVAFVNPQGEPPGYNRARTSILNAPFINVDKGEDDGVETAAEASRPGFNNVYITYFDGRTPAAAGPPYLPAADIHLSTSTNNGGTFGPEVKVNDDDGSRSHVFPSVQANKNGFVFTTWLDRRNDPANRLTDAWAAVSKNLGTSFGHSKLQTDIATDWFVRSDARPNFGDYNSSELLGFNQFVGVWADGRFPPGTFLDVRPPAPPPATERRSATPDVIFTIMQGLGVGNDPNPNNP